MQPHLESRFIELEVARTAHTIKRMAFASRFAVLFNALAKDMELTPDELGDRMGWSPVPEDGNAVMRGDAEPSPEDCYRLVEIYLAKGK